jgi:spore coat protein U-like protein
MKTVRIALLTAAAAALLVAADASAQTVTDQFVVTASVAENCRIDAAPDIAITTAGSPWDPTSGALPPPVAGTFTLRCTRGTSYTLDLNGGTYTDVMTHTNGTDTLPYKFFVGAGCASDFAAITATAPNRSAQNYTICAGLDPAGAALFDLAPAGDYSDTVTVSVNF